MSETGALAMLAIGLFFLFVVAGGALYIASKSRTLTVVGALCITAWVLALCFPLGGVKYVLERVVGK